MGDFIFPRKIGIAVALGAGLREVELENRRGFIGDGQDVMRAVTVPAISSAGRAEGVTHAVDAGGVLGGFLLMAMGAVGRRQSGIVDKFLDASMAIRAMQFGVDRAVKAIGGEHGQRDVFAIHGAGRSRVGMTIQAIGVGQLIVRAGDEEAGEQAKEDDSLP